MTLEEQIADLELWVKEMEMAGLPYEIGWVDDPGPGVMITDPMEPPRVTYEILYFLYHWDDRTWRVYNDIFSFDPKKPTKERLASSVVDYETGVRMIKDKVRYG